MRLTDIIALAALAGALAACEPHVERLEVLRGEAAARSFEDGVDPDQEVRLVVEPTAKRIPMTPYAERARWAPRMSVGLIVDTHTGAAVVGLKVEDECRPLTYYGSGVWSKSIKCNRALRGHIQLGLDLAARERTGKPAYPKWVGEYLKARYSGFVPKTESSWLDPEPGTNQSPLTAEQMRYEFVPVGGSGMQPLSQAALEIIDRREVAFMARFGRYSVDVLRDVVPGTWNAETSTAVDARARALCAGASTAPEDIGAIVARLICRWDAAQEITGNPLWPNPAPGGTSL